MTVLVVTKSDDPSAAPVIAAIERRGGRAFRFDTDRYPSEVWLTAASSGTDLDITVGDGRGKPLRLADVRAVWVRRFDTAARAMAEVDPGLRPAIHREAQAVLLWALGARDVYRLNDYWQNRVAENKLRQLVLAAAVGLDTPRSIVTSRAADVRAFAATVPAGLVTKMLTSFATPSGQVMYTNALSDADLADLDGLELCPMTFQEKIEKAVELRVTIIGDRVFAASLASQQHERGRLDWRRVGVETLEEWRPYELPGELSARLVALMDRLGLDYGAADVIVTPDDRHVFLEVNPAGEFHWIEHSAGLPLSDAIAAQLLTGPTAGRRRG